jgi:hypothetical protein
MRSIALGFLVVAHSGTAVADEPRWAGSELGIKHAAGVWTSIPGADPTYDPIVLQTISLDPQWRLRRDWLLAGHVGVETELTNSDTTTRERQPLLEDAWVQTARELPWGGAASVRLYLPTSRESWARRRLFTLAPAIAFHREHGRFTARAGARAAWHAALEETTVYEGPSILGCDPARTSCEAFSHSGIRSTMATFVQTVAVDVALPGAVTATAEMGWIEGLLYPLEGSDSTRWRMFNVYLIGAEWRPSAAWRLGAGFQTLNPQRAPDTTFYAPFFNRYTQLYVSASRVF